jgi:hypothetical protein
MEFQNSLPCSQVSATGSYSESSESCPHLPTQYLLTYLLIPWCKKLFEKLIVTQLVKNILLSLWNPKVHHRIHKSPPPEPILSQLNPVRPIDSYLPKVQLNVIFSPTPRSSQWSLAFGPPNRKPVNTSPLPYACHMSSPPHPP